MADLPIKLSRESERLVSKFRDVVRTQDTPYLSVVFDAFNREAAFQTGATNTWYTVVYGPDGYKFAKLSGTTPVQYTFPLAAGAKLIYNSQGLQYYQHSDWLGSSRVASTPGQTLEYDGSYGPFGESYSETGTTTRLFTGQTQDAISGLYDFPFRQYSPVQGRWMVPDPGGKTVVDIANPQTWNRYGYVGDSPLNTVDPTGLIKLAFYPDLSGLFGLDCGGDFCAFPEFFPIDDPGGGGGGGGGHNTSNDCVDHREGFHASSPKQCTKPGPPKTPKPAPPPPPTQPTQQQQCVQEAYTAFNQRQTAFYNGKAKQAGVDIVEGAIGGCIGGLETGCLPGAGIGALLGFGWSVINLTPANWQFDNQNNAQLQQDLQQKCGISGGSNNTTE